MQASDRLPHPAWPRRRLADWLAQPLPATWLLVAGPGSGKTFAAHAIATALGEPVHWFTADRLPEDLPEKGTLVIDGAERLIGTEAFAALERRLTGSRRAEGYTIVTSRLPLPVSLARKVAFGEVRVLGPEALWFTPEEAPGGDVRLEGWPLGAYAAAALAKSAHPEKVLAELVEEEWLGALPGAFRARLAPLTVLDGPSAEELTPDELAFGRAWGLWRPGQAGDRWHALVREGLRAEAGEAAIAVLRRAGKRWLLGGQVDRLEAALKRVDGSHPAVLLLAGAVEQARGAYVEAEARYRQAREAARAAGDRALEFEALGDLVHLFWTKEDLAALEAAIAEAAPLEAEAPIAERAEFWNNLACHRFGQEDEAGAEALWHRVLDVPHLEDLQIASVQQFAAMNLGILAKERGDFDEALRQFRHVIELSERFRLKPSVPRGARLYSAAVALKQGDRPLAEARFAELAANPIPAEERYRRAEFLQVEGDYFLLTGAFAEAEACFREALALFAALRMETNADAGLALNQLAVIHRRRGELEVASRLHAEAAPLVAPWPRYQAQALLDTAVTRMVAGDEAAAGSALDQAAACLERAPAKHLQAAVELARAVWAGRRGADAEAEAALKRAVAIVRAEPLYYAPIAQRELAPEIWLLMAKHGHTAVLEAIESRFPRAAEGIRRDVAARQSAADVLPPVAAPAVTIRCLGDLVVQVAGEPPAAWPRKKAKALLGWLILRPEGVGREELADRLFPELGFEEGQHQLDNLLSSLRKILEPELGRRQKSRYLTVQEKRIRLERDGLAIDWVEFEAAYRARDFARAMALYRGELLAEPLMRDWFELERHRASAMAVEMLTELAEAAIAGEHFDQARACWERLLTLDPTHEEAHRQLMRLYARFGQPQLVARQYQALEKVLRQELDEAPSPETRALLAALMP